MRSSVHLSALPSKAWPLASRVWVHVPWTPAPVPLPMLSLQIGAAPPTQAPPERVSPVVQAFPSSHGLLLLVNTHPVPGSHVSVVQMLLSLQVGAGPPTHTPPEQVSPVVHALLSSHGAV